jgi:2-amino-4-hydroxy-6-hydroxymethyldihydropteridine diphosphokinase
VTPVAVALGSNLGDRERTLREALAVLRKTIPDLRVSAIQETRPVGVGDQPLFLNAAATGHTHHTVFDLLQTLLDIEQQFGRKRPYPGAPRTLDLDLILYGDLIVDETGIVVPHPRFRERAFVLAPLAEIAPQWIDPVTGLSIAELLSRLDGFAEG